VKYEFWVWMAIWAGFVIAYERTEDAMYASGVTLIGISPLPGWPCIRCGRRANKPRRNDENTNRHCRTDGDTLVSSAQV